MWNTLKLFLNPFDARYEDLAKGPKHLVVLRDFSAGLIVAMMAIPLAMGFAMASGLKPEQGIVGGAVAGLVGALFGGSKYQVYGPTAAFIPLIAGLMSAYATPTDPYAGHGFLVLASVISGVILMALGLSGLGKLAKWVPHSIVVGFTLGIAVTIALSQIGEVLGIGMELESILKKALQDPQVSIPGYGFFLKLRVIGEHLGEYRGEALLLALVTFLVTKYLLKISIYIPAPLVAIAIGIFLSRALSDGSELTLIKTKFGQIPTDFFVLTLPVLPDWNLGVFRDLAYFVVAIVFVSGIESLLCSRMADRLADNQGTPFNPNKEFWGQGLVQILVPILNGFPHTGALARTATNIKVGAVTPLAGIFKCFLKLGLAYYLASYLELVPMACIGGILMWVAANMVKPAEIRQVFAHNWFHVFLMSYTAIAVIVTDFMTGVLTALVLYGVLFKFFDTSPSDPAPREEPQPAGELLAVGDRCVRADAPAERSLMPLSHSRQGLRSVDLADDEARARVALKPPPLTGERPCTVIEISWWAWPVRTPTSGSFATPRWRQSWVPPKEFALFTCCPTPPTPRPNATTIASVPNCRPTFNRTCGICPRPSRCPTTSCTDRWWISCWPMRRSSKWTCCSWATDSKLPGAKRSPGDWR